MQSDLDDITQLFKEWNIRQTQRKHASAASASARERTKAFGASGVDKTNVGPRDRNTDARRKWKVDEENAQQRRTKREKLKKENP